MEIFRYFKQIYSGKNALANHVSLFSLAGILVILFIKYTASWGNLLFYDNFYISVPSSTKELWAYLFFGMLLLIYFIGYGVNLVNDVMNNKENRLPNITLQPFTFFVKMLPMAVYWIAFYLLICTGGIFALLKLNNSGFIYIFSSVMFCIIPFILILLTQFAKNFEFRKKFFNLFSVFKILEKTLGDVIFLSLGTFALAVIPFFVIYKILAYPVGDEVLNLNLVIKLGALCFVFYLCLIFNYVYFAGLADISKKQLK